MMSHIEPNPLITIVVVNWNGYPYLEECLQSLERQTWPETEIILVDNGSSDQSVDIVERWSEEKRVRLIQLDENKGFTVANNMAFRIARGEWIALLNNDAVAEPDWLEKLVSAGNPPEKLGMVGGKILNYHQRNLIDKVGHLIYPDGQNRGRGTGQVDRGQFDREEEILWPDGCACLYHRQLLDETGGFDDDFFAYGDDADLGLRARLLGWRAWYVPEAVVYHRHSSTAGAFSPLKIMLVERNRVLLAIKNFPILLLLQNPYWTVLRYFWQVVAACRGKGSSGSFSKEHGPLHLPLMVLWAHASAAKRLPAVLAKRRHVQKSRHLSSGQVRKLISRFRISLRELTYGG